MSMNRIDKITLQNLVPPVFMGDPDHEKRHSDVWRRNTSLERGKLYCIDAASGTGKTSLCSFLFGVRRDYAGSIIFNDTNISSYKIKDWCEIRRRHLAYMPQELDVFGELTALDNILLKNRLTHFKTEAEIRQMFEELEIDNRINSYCARMSVGQRQRVALIRSLCQPLDFILLDEPVSHLDAVNNAKCAAMVVAEARRQEASVVSTSVGNPLAITDPIVLKL